jgi:hypothetical protein
VVSLIGEAGVLPRHYRAREPAVVVFWDQLFVGILGRPTKRHIGIWHQLDVALWNVIAALGQRQDQLNTVPRGSQRHVAQQCRWGKEKHRKRPRAGQRRRREQDQVELWSNYLGMADVLDSRYVLRIPVVVSCYILRA